MTTEILKLWRVLRGFRARSWAIAVLGLAGSLLLLGVPAAIIETPFFVRMTPVRLQDYIVWYITAILVGLIAGTYTLPVRASCQGKVTTGGILSLLAIGCPICNKIVVLLLGISGALAFFAPLQLYIGIVSVVLLAWTLLLRVHAIVGSSPGVAASTNRQPV